IDGTAALYGDDLSDGENVLTPEFLPTPEPTPAPRMARVTLSSKDGKLNLRSQPNTTSSILAELPDGTIVTVLEDEGNWKQVSVNGLVGYLRQDYLREVEPDEAAAVASSIAAPASAASVTLELPYYIEVDRGMQVVRVYTMGEDGTYSLLAREMICSTDSFNRKPPNGTYVMDGEKQRWLITFTPDSYAQYATRITGHILFHSVPYSALTSDSLNAEAYAALGTNASIGCVRLLCADAKWIYDNVPAGTVVKYVTSPRDEDKLSELAAPPLGSGKWDPTDPEEGNPDYNPDYAASHPAATPVPGVTPAPTAPWIPDTYA
ncbi:MAG: SH3 domain-containing protein, partial [Clostridia bacterium]|nr:SH3 domain-containing protein [Clostridia bacterium]